MKTILTAFIVTAILTTSSAIAEGLDYNYLQFAYEIGELEVLGTDFDFDGVSVSGSHELNDVVFLNGGYATGGFDDVDVDIDILSFGVGARFDISQTTETHFVVGLSVSRVEFDSSFGDDSETDETIGFALRHMATDTFELSGGLSVSDGDTMFSLGGRVKPMPNFALGVFLDTGDSVEILGFTAQFIL